MSDLIARGRAWKQAHPDFPLYVHASGRYSKKVNGTLLFFGKVTDDIEGSARAAWDKWLDDKEYLLNNRKPPERAANGVVTVKYLCDAFLTAKEQARDAGRISPRTFLDYETTAKLVAQELGRNRAVTDLRSADFQSLLASLSKRLGVIAIGNTIQRVRTIFKWGYDADLLPSPMKFGPEFKKPKRADMRKARAAAGVKMFEAKEIHKLLHAASPQLKAMILLAINCGFGNQDCATLAVDAIDLESGWITYPRPKTGINRRCPLWPETVKRLKRVLAKRKEPKDPAHARLVFVTKRSGTWAKDIGGGPVAKEFAKIVKKAGLSQRGRGFYSLRHSFRTIADATRDFPAIDLVMGHCDDSMADRYRERIDDERLQAVSDHVRAWLFPKPTKDGKKPSPGKPKRAPAKSPRKAAEKAKPDRPILRIVG